MLSIIRGIECCRKYPVLHLFSTGLRGLCSGGFRRILPAIIIWFGASWCLTAQSGTIEGWVLTPDGEQAAGAYVQLDSLLPTVADEEGRFFFSAVQPGSHVINTSYVGLGTTRKEIWLEEGQKIELELKIEETAAQLNAVMVTAKSEGSSLRERVSSISVLETRDFYLQSNNTSEVIKQIPGLNVRQTGGFGSDAVVSINGMSGKQVKFFLDGIPLSYFGSGLGLNVLPVNMMERIEVYKGVVPVHLGADALGGAINIVRRSDYRSYVDAAYSFGSFNSHRANFNGQFVHPEKGFLLGVNSFYNHSDNNYSVDVSVPNEFGNPEPVSVKRFHDRFSNYLVNMYAGVRDKPYADKLLLSVRYSGIADDIQHNAIMAQPYGEAIYHESTRGFALEYEKQQLLPQTDLQWYLGANSTNGNFIDTTLNVYTWDGQVNRRKTDGGELSASGNLLHLRPRNAVSRLNADYSPWSSGSFTFNLFTSWFKRTGEDAVAADFYGQDYYSTPTVLIKNATGLAYEHTFSPSLIGYTSLKHFAYSAEGYSLQNLEFQPNKQSVSNFGYGQSLRYVFSDQWLAKASYEYATRLPDELELFGDFTLVRANPFLSPEQSHNVNLSGQFRSDKADIELNGFFRYTDNIIWLRTSQFFAQYQNLLSAITRGVDAEIRYRPFEFLKLTTNVTYQDIRNRSSRSVTGSVDDRYYNARLPNLPYLFGHAEIRYQQKNVGGVPNRVSAWWSASYVNEFFLFWANDGNPELKNTIPTQFIQNAGVSYALPENRLSVSLEVANLLDQTAFDNFSVQRPGRAFYITLRHYLSFKTKTK